MSSSHTAARRVPRSYAILPCPACSEPVGRNYAQCPGCTEVVDRIWLADWAALLAAEGVAPGTEDEKLLARVVFAEAEQHPWTAVNVATSMLTCGTCGAELAGGPTDCTECHLAFGAAMASEQAAGRVGLVSMNEHALHIGRWVLRHRHRISPNIVKGWQLTYPYILAGAEPPAAKAVQHASRLWNERGDSGETIRIWEEGLARAAAQVRASTQAHRPSH
jgi:hypothetical protein